MLREFVDVALNRLFAFAFAVKVKAVEDEAVAGELERQAALQERADRLRDRGHDGLADAMEERAKANGLQPGEVRVGSILQVAEDNSSGNQLLLAPPKAKKKTTRKKRVAKRTQKR